jgi:hypothetical protein
MTIKEGISLVEFLENPRAMPSVKELILTL